MIYEATGPGKLLDYINASGRPQDVNYASLTAPDVVRMEMQIDGVICEIVYVGNGDTHSWWTQAGGKFFPPEIAPGGLAPGSRLLLTVSGVCALRIDWM